MSSIRSFIIKLPKMACLGALFLGRVCLAEIIDIKSYAEALYAVKDADLVVFDIDNTLLRPAQTIGSDQWYGHRVQKYKETGVSESAAIDKAIEDWIKVQKQTQVLLTEQIAVELFQTLKEREIPFIGLTARPPVLAVTTQLQLAAVNLVFHQMDGAENYRNQSTDILYKSGVLFVGPKNKKGPALREFLNQVSGEYRKIVFFDDKKKHVESLEETFSDKEYLGFRYGALDGWVQSFDVELSDLQWNRFEKDYKLYPDSYFMPSFLFQLKCRGSGDLRSLTIQQTGLRRFMLSYILDVDAPGASSWSQEIEIVGEASLLEFKTENHELFASPINSKEWILEFKNDFATLARGSKLTCERTF